MLNSGVILVCVAMTLTIPQAYAVQQILDTAEETPSMSCILARDDLMCLQADTAYIEDALKRLQASYTQTGWLDSKVIPGTKHCCYDQGLKRENHNPLTPAHLLGGCFEKASFWFDDDKDPEFLKMYEMMTMYMDVGFMAEYNDLHPGANVTTTGIDCP